MNEYPLGQSVRLTAAFINSSGAAANPTTTTFRYGVALVNPPPDPTATSLVFGVDGEVINDSTGNFHADITPTVPGIYSYDAVGTGAVAAVTPLKRFRILPSPFA